MNEIFDNSKICCLLIPHFQIADHGIAKSLPVYIFRRSRCIYSNNAQPCRYDTDGEISKQQDDSFLGGLRSQSTGNYLHCVQWEE